MPSTPETSDLLYPKLAAHARLQDDKLSGATMLLYPEGALVLDDAAAEIAKRCDGSRTVQTIRVELMEIFAGSRKPRRWGCCMSGSRGASRCCILICLGSSRRRGGQVSIQT